MTEINNGYGEMMPESVAITLHFDVEGRLVTVTTPVAQVPAGKEWPAYIFTFFKTELENKKGTREISTSTDKSIVFNTYAPTERSFLYMDVGRWGGKQGQTLLRNVPTPQLAAEDPDHRDFGIVCGCHAVLCRFHNWPRKKIYCGGSDDAARNIYDLAKTLCGSRYGVEFVKWESIQGASPPKPIYVFLGDLHLPIAKSMPNNPANDNLKDWYRDYLKGDIFRGGAYDLLLFLTQIEKAAQELYIHFVQVGDMYDLWIGLGKYYESVSGPPGKVILKKPIQETKRFISSCIERSNKCYPELTEKFVSLAVKKKTYLYGNHDNYLAVFSPGLVGRQRFLRKSGLYIEHGHWADSSNYDGNSGMLGGHRLTNYVFAVPGLRYADPQRRHHYTAAAAIEYYDKRDFKIFVMGHTHMPYLTKVRVNALKQIRDAGIEDKPKDGGI